MNSDKPNSHREALGKLQALMQRERVPQRTVVSFKQQLEEMKLGKRPWPVPELVAKNAEGLSGIDPVAVENHKNIGKFRTLRASQDAKETSKRHNPTQQEIEQRASRFLALSDKQKVDEVEDALFMPATDESVSPVLITEGLFNEEQR